MSPPQRSSSSPPYIRSYTLRRVRRRPGLRLRTAFTGMNRWLGTLAETGAVIGVVTAAACRLIWGLGWRIVFQVIPLIRLMRHRSSS